MKKYLITDIRRLIKNRRFYVSVLGAAAALFFSLERKGLRNSVLESYIASVTGSGVHITGVFCAYAFATVYCEDFESYYVRYEIIRGNIKKYILSKTVMIYLSAVVVMFMGTLIFCSICSVFLPWAKESDSVYKMTASGNYGQFVLAGRYLTYCLLFSLQLGMFMGILAVAASYLSLFTSNIALVLSFPVLLDQFLLEIPSNNILNFLEFWPVPKGSSEDWQALLYSLFLSIISVILLTLGIYKRVKKML